MNRKKLVSLCLVLALLVTAAIGGTMAYFTDTDKETNTFTVGNVDIDLQENFDQDAELAPGNKEMNNVKKEVYVKNIGHNDAYVRVHIAIPTLLDDGDPNFDASKNVLHFNNSNMAKGQWNWSTSLDRPADEYTNEDGNWNFYTTKIDGIDYNVYVVTYETAIEANETTPAAMNQVYLDSGVTNADIEKLNAAFGEKGWNIEVFAQAVQADGFEDAYAAFAEAFDKGGIKSPWN